jgi:hypothetical protein
MCCSWTGGGGGGGDHKQGPLRFIRAAIDDVKRAMAMHTAAGGGAKPAVGDANELAG